MLNMFLDLVMALVSIIKIPLIVLGATLLLFFVLLFINIIMLRKEGYRFKGGRPKYIKKPSIFYRIFVKAPRQYAIDMYNREPDFFDPQGLVIFTGRQGYGKTISMMQYARELQKRYTKVKCLSNTDYKYQTDKLKHWKQLVNYKNGKQGIVVVMDELQNWFSSNQSKNFPPEMLGVITQNRKNRRIILGTSQNFYLLAKAIRSQATEVRECFTIAGCITFVRRREPILDSEGNVVEFKHRGLYFYVHDRDLRESYDTYAVVDSLVKSGFQDRDYLKEYGNLVVNMD